MGEEDKGQGTSDTCKYVIAKVQRYLETHVTPIGPLVQAVPRVHLTSQPVDTLRRVVDVGEDVGRDEAGQWKGERDQWTMDEWNGVLTTVTLRWRRWMPIGRQCCDTPAELSTNRSAGTC